MTETVLPPPTPPTMHSVMLVDAATRTKFQFQIVGYYDFPAPGGRKLGFLDKVIIEPMSEAEVAEFFGPQAEDGDLLGDSAAGEQLTPEQGERIKKFLSNDGDTIDEEAEEAEAAKRIEEIRRSIVEEKNKEDK